jgi:hypothetical protein
MKWGQAGEGRGSGGGEEEEEEAVLEEKLREVMQGPRRGAGGWQSG